MNRTSVIRPYRPAKAPVAARGFRELPIDLLRTSLITRDPKRVQAAAQQYAAVMQGQAQAPTILPQSMLFGHWNRQQGPNGGVRGDLTPPLASAQGVMAAMRQSGTARAPRVTSPAPQLPMHAAAAARGGQRVPSPGGEVSQTPPVSRRFPSPPPVMSPPPSAYANSVGAVRGVRERQRVDSRSVATLEAMNAANAASLIFKGSR